MNVNRIITCFLLHINTWSVSTVCIASTCTTITLRRNKDSIIVFARRISVSQPQLRRLSLRPVQTGIVSVAHKVKSFDIHVFCVRMFIACVIISSPNDTYKWVIRSYRQVDFTVECVSCTCRYDVAFCGVHVASLLEPSIESERAFFWKTPSGIFTSQSTNEELTGNEFTNGVPFSPQGVVRVKN